MSIKLSSHTRAVFQAFLVTFLWATSWVLIKHGLQDIPALPFAGLRYTLAFLFLLPFGVRSGAVRTLQKLPWATWRRLLSLGLLLYAATQGAQFLSLAYLPAATASLMLSFTAVIVALAGVWLLRERPRPLQWLGAGFYLAGVLIYLYPASFPRADRIGLVVALAGVLANAAAALLGRAINRRGDLDPLAITLASMGSGAIVLLLVGIAVQGLPSLSLTNWLIILWLAAVNSAFAFTLWNRTMRELSAMESTVINNTMLFQIAILAWLFLGETLSARQIVAILIALIGTVLVQWRPHAGRPHAGRPQAAYNPGEPNSRVLKKDDPSANRTGHALDSRGDDGI